MNSSHLAHPVNMKNSTMTQVAVLEELITTEKLYKGISLLLVMLAQSFYTWLIGNEFSLLILNKKV